MSNAQGNVPAYRQAGNVQQGMSNVQGGVALGICCHLIPNCQRE